MNFVYRLKEPTFSFIDLCYCFLHFYFICLCSDLYDFFPCINFGCSLFFFLVALGVRLNCLFEIFLVSWGELELLWTSLLELPLLPPIDFGSSCFRCHLFLGILRFLLWFLQWSLGYLAVCCLASMCLYFLQFFFL